MDISINECVREVKNNKKENIQRTAEEMILIIKNVLTTQRHHPNLSIKLSLLFTVSKLCLLILSITVNHMHNVFILYFELI